MESFLADLKNKVQCSLCNDTLTEPKILQCFHTFCKLCIKRHAKVIDQVNVFKCPKCSSQTSLPELSSVEDLQPSPLHSRMLKGLALVEDEKVCSVSESHSPASWYCFDCDRKMCDECKKYHSEFTQDHKVVGLADLKKDIELIITRENPCKSHPTHKIELFCQQCQTMICVACLKHDHKDHKIMSLHNLASVKKAVLSKHLQVLEHLRSDDKEKQQQEKARKQVNDKANEIVKMVQENERELLRQIDEKLDTATRNLNIIHHLPAVKEYLQNVMERGLASEMINIQETQCSEKFIFNTIPLYSTIVFIPNDDLMRQVNSGLGGIQTSCQTDHTMSTIQVESEIEAARKKKLILMTRTSTGKNSINTGDVVDVQISPEDHVQIEEKYVRSEGKIEVEFTAKVPGPLTAEVQVNGNHVSNSHLVMNVKLQQMRKKQFDINGVNTGFRGLKGIAVNRDNSRIAVADCDWSSHCIRLFNTDGDLLLTYGSQGSAQGQLSYPEGLAFLNDTDLVIADYGNHRICIVNTTTGTLVKTFGNQGNGNGQFYHPCGVHVDDDGNIIVSDKDNHRVQVFTRDGHYQYQFGLTGQDKFDPISTVTHGGLFYVSDNHVIHVFKKKGNVLTRISTTEKMIQSHIGQVTKKPKPSSLAIDNDLNLLVLYDYDANRIQKFTLDGRLVGTLLDIEHPKYILISIKFVTLKPTKLRPTRIMGRYVLYVSTIFL